MDNPFLNGPKQASQAWRSVRGLLTSDKDDSDHLSIVCDFWAKAPIVAPYLDWDGPETWPDPWELISERKFDPSAVALGMEYTLMLADDGRWSPDRLQLVLVSSMDKSMQGLLLIVDGQYVLNHHYNGVVMLEEARKDFVIQQRYAYINKKHQVLKDNLSSFYRE